MRKIVFGIITVTITGLAIPHELLRAQAKEEAGRNIDFNGVILLSQILNYDNGADWPQLNPGIDLPSN